MSGEEHPLHRILVEAAAGRPPAPDGSITILPPVEGPVDAICSFTAHNVLAVDLPREELLAQLDADDFGSPMSATFLAWLGRRLGAMPGVLDNVMVAPDHPKAPVVELVVRTNLDAHPRVRKAADFEPTSGCSPTLPDEAS